MSTRRRIERQDGEHTATRIIHCHRGPCRWCCLQLRSCGNKQGHHANIHGREEVGHHNLICPCTCRQLSLALPYADAAPHVGIAAGSLHVLHIVLNLIVASFALVLDNRFYEEGGWGLHWGGEQSQAQHMTTNKTTWTRHFIWSF